MASFEQPLSMRYSGTVDERFDSLHEGVPVWMYESIASWFRSYLLRCSETVGDQIERNLRVALPAATGSARSGTRRPISGQARIWAAIGSFGESFQLDLVDWALRAAPVNLASYSAREVRETFIDSMEDLLEEAGSAWRVDEHMNGGWALHRRVPTTTVLARDHALSLANDPDDHLRKAWFAAFGRDPNSRAAYSEAVNAVEAIACPKVLPNKQNATLGNVIGELRSNSKWKATFRPNPSKPPKQGAVQIVADNCELLWNSDPRHGNDLRGVPTQDEAESAVILATALVGLFATSKIHS